MIALERFLVGLDSQPWNAVWRFGLGLSMPPIFHAFAGHSAPVWMPLALFVCLLIWLYLIPAVLRRVIPFSTEAKRIWSERRKTAKRHDSYQWQKLLWIGLGLTTDAVIGVGLMDGEILLTLICLIGGSAGLFFWQRSRAPVPTALMTRAHP